ncbi:MAG TPA: sugar phosphate isomerase/epimerase [Candidatus Dormibacteraeota bacterium]
MIAAQLYTIRGKLQDPRRLGGVLGRLREIGYRAVEVAGLGRKTIDIFGAELKKADLIACAAHQPLESVAREPAAVAEQCREWGCGYVVIPSLPDDYRSAAGFRRFAGEAAGLARGLQPHGLQLAYHNHAFELQRWEGQTGLETLFAATTAETLQAEPDTYWLQYGGANPAAWVRRLRGRVPLLHLKDMAVDRGQPVQVEVGEGNLDWVEILGAAREAGTEWLIVEQDESQRDPMESLAISYRNLVKLCAQAGLENKDA